MASASDFNPNWENRIEKQTVVPPITGGVATERIKESKNAAATQDQVTSTPYMPAVKRLHAIKTMQWPGLKSTLPRL